jgi:anti-sigma B factor antagonist
MSALPQTPPLQTQPVADGTLVRFPCADFDELTTNGLTDALYDLALSQGQPSLYLDLDDVQYLASITMGRLIVLDKKLRDAGGRLHLCNLNRQVYDVFRVSRLTLLLDVRPKDHVVH